MHIDPEKRHTRRFEQESIVMIGEPDKGYYTCGTMHNFSGDGMYLEADFVGRPGTRILIQMTEPLVRSLPKVVSGEVRWSRDLFEGESNYAHGLGIRLGR